MMRHVFRTALALAVVVAPALRAQAVSSDSRPTVAIMHFNNGATGKAHEELDALRGGIADILISEMSVNPAIRVVERDQVDKLVAEQNLGATDKVDKATAVRIGKLLGAHHMIFGGYMTDRKNRMRLDARAVNVETGEIEYTQSVSGSTDDFSDMIASLAAKLNKGMKLPAMAMRTSDATVASKPPFQVVMLYSRAIAEENGGRKDEAVKLYKAALDKFPQYAAAKKALTRLESPKSGE
jgi:TolB-like protein